MQNTEQQILDEPAVQLVPANLLKRFTNYFIDVVIFSFLLTFLLVVAAPVYPLINKIIQKQPVDLTDQLMISFFYGFYMSAMEALLKGKTIGKYITGTRAVTDSGLPVSSRTAFLRGLIRIIPFEQLSIILFAPFPWHDRWSKSMVVDENKSILPKN